MTRIFEHGKKLDEKSGKVGKSGTHAKNKPPHMNAGCFLLCIVLVLALPFSLVGFAVFFWWILLSFFF